MSERENHTYIEPGYKPMSIPEWSIEPTASALSHNVTGAADRDVAACADPAQIYPFEGAPRAGIVFDDARDGELSADILANGMIEPAIIWNDGEVDRLISGNRRRAACLHLRQLGHEIPFPVRRLDIDFATALVVAHASNTGRERPTAMEQAKAVAWAVNLKDKSQKEIARLLRFDEAKVSRLLTLSSLPDWLINCATDPNQLSEKVASQLQAPLQDAIVLDLMKARSDQLKAANKALPGATLVRYLLTGSGAVGCQEYTDDSGRVLVRSSINAKGAITLKIPPVYRSDGFEPAHLEHAVRRAIAEAMNSSSS